jgi:hypothetical protein
LLLWSGGWWVMVVVVVGLRCEYVLVDAWIIFSDLIFFFFFFCLFHFLGGGV